MSMRRRKMVRDEETVDQLVEMLYSKMEERIRKDILSDENSIEIILSRVREILSKRIEEDYTFGRKRAEEVFRENASVYASSEAFERAKAYRMKSIQENYTLYEKRKALLEDLRL